MSIETSKGFFFRHRTLIMVLGLLAFMPPLALLFQVSTGDSGFCGRWCPRMFFVWREGMSFGQFMFGWLRSFMGVALVFGILISTLFWGRYWCSHICPVGGTLELGSKLLPQALKIPYNKVPAAPVRYGYFAVYLIAPAIGIGSLCCNYCNFAAVPRVFGAAFGSPADMAYFFRAYGLINLAMLVLLGIAARGGRAYCNFFCPVGALDALCAKLGGRFGKRFRILEHRCNSCGKCEEVCPTWSIELNPQKQTINQLSCMPCGACQDICTEGAITYGRCSEASNEGTK